MRKQLVCAIASAMIACLLLAPAAYAQEGDGSSSSESGPIADPYVPEIPDLPTIEAPDYGTVPELPQITAPDYGTVPELPQITAPDYGTVPETQETAPADYGSVSEPPPIVEPDYSGTASGTEAYPDTGGTQDLGSTTGEASPSYGETDGSSASTESGTTFYEFGSVAPPAEIPQIDPVPDNPDAGSTYDSSESSGDGGSEETSESCLTVDGIGVCQ